MRNACSRTLCALAVGLGWVQAGLAVEALQPQPLPAISAASNQSVSSQGDSTSRLASYSDSAALSPADSRPNLSPCSDGSCQTDCVGRWRDNVEIWSVGDEFRNIGDVVRTFGGGVPVIANFGLRTVVNSGFALGNSKIRGQIGGSLGVYDLQGLDTALFAPNRDAQIQNFFTGGIYKRSNVVIGERVAWGLVYDEFMSNNWGYLAQSPALGQMRGLLSYAVNDFNAFGVTGAWGMHSSRALAFNGPGNVFSSINTMSYTNVFWTHNYKFGGDTTTFIGAAEGSRIGSWLFGFSGRAPLGERAAVYSSFTYVVPHAPFATGDSSRETWNITAGLVFYLGRKAVAPNISGQQGLPLMNVADNGSMLVSN